MANSCLWIPRRWSRTSTSHRRLRPRPPRRNPRPPPGAPPPAPPPAPTPPAALPAPAPPVAETVEVEPLDTTVVATRNVNVRGAPNIDTDPLDVVAQGAEVAVV